MTYKELMRNFEQRKKPVMYGSGYHCFMVFISTDTHYVNKQMGLPPRTDISGMEAAQKLDLWGKISPIGTDQFMEGWEDAKQAYLAASNQTVH